jgi:hypothetical protein
MKIFVFVIVGLVSWALPADANIIYQSIPDLTAAAGDAMPGGKVGYLKWLAKNNSSAFAGLLGKVLPTTIAGDPANPIPSSARG